MLLILIVCLLLTGLLGTFVFSAAAAPVAEQAREIRLQALRERKKAVYENLKDLHFEHLAGKLSDADFQRTRGMLEREAAGVVAALEAAEGIDHRS